MAILPPDPVYCYKSDMGHIHSLTFCAKTDDYCPQLLAATEKGIVYFWDLEANRVLYKQKMGESIQTIHYYKDNIITQEKSGLVKLWATLGKSYEIKEKYECAGGFCKSVLLNNVLIVPQDDSSVDVLDINTLKKIKQLLPDREKLGSVMCLETGKIGGKICVMAGYESGDIILWDLDSSKPSGHLKLQEHITSITFDSDNGRAVCGNASNTLQLFHVDKSFNMALKCELSITNEGCNVVKVRPDKRVFVSCGWDGRLRIFSCKTLRILAVLDQHRGAITDVQFSPCKINFYKSNIMAVSGADGMITLWNLYNNSNN